MKCLIIGLDGATWRVLDNLILAGYLPNIKKMIESGASGTLMSTTPPITALAWPTFMTGKNPGKHGILSWHMPFDQAFQRALVSSVNIDGETLWDILGNTGQRLCIVNVPMTFPPKPVNGVIVTGMMTPGVNANFTYPSSLRSDLLMIEPNYKTDMEFLDKQRHTESIRVVGELLSHAEEIVRLRGRTFRWLIEKEIPDVGMLVFEMTDRLQHVLWDYIAVLPSSLDSSNHARSIQVRLLNCFSVLDEEVGRIAELVDSNGLTVILSDHGFGPMKSNLHVNDWLAEHGWLSYLPLQSGLWMTMRKLGRRFRKMLPTKIIERAQRAVSPVNAINWQKTVAYSGIPTEYGIFLNCAGREPAGIVTKDDYENLRSSIITALKNWRRPESGELVIKQACRREEIYSGPHLELAPDIVFSAEPGYVISELPAPEPGSVVAAVGQEPWGFHEPEGIVVFTGPQICPAATIDDSRIEDILPTILYALGLAIPQDLDGRVLTDVFDGNWQAGHPIEYREASKIDKNGYVEIETSYSEHETALLNNRLRDLGYLE